MEGEREDKKTRMRRTGRQRWSSYLDTVNKPSPLVDELIVGGGHLEEFNRVCTASKLSKAVHE